MSALQQNWIATAYLSPVTAPVAVGSCMGLDAPGVYHQLATLAARTAAARTQAVSGIAITAGDATSPSIEIQTCGPCPPSITLLGAGAAGPIIVADTGFLARKASPTGSDLVVGKCDTDGWAYLNFAGSSASAGSGFTPPTGTGFMTVTGGVMDVAALAQPLAVNKGGTAFTTASLAGQANKAVTVNPGETGYNFTTIPAGASTPTGTGFRHVTGGIEDPAAQQVFNADVNTTANIAITKLATGANGNYFQVVGGVNTFAAPSIALGSQVTGTLPLANQAAPTGTGFATVTAGAWDAAALAQPLAIAKGGIGVSALPGSSLQFLINNGGALGATSGVTFPGTSRIGSGTGTLHTSARLSFDYNAGSAYVVMGWKDSVNGDRAWITYGPGDAATIGNAGQDLHITTGTQGDINLASLSSWFSAGGGSLPNQGFFRFAYNSGSVRSIMSVLDSTATARDFLQYGAGDQWIINNASQDLTIKALSTIQISVGAASVMAIQAAKINCSQPVGGNSTDSVPFRWSKAAITLASGMTLTPSQYSCVYQEFTSALGSGTFVVNAVDSTGAFAWIRNTSAASLITYKKTAGTGFTLGVSHNAFGMHTGSDWVRGSADCADTP